ncbi:MAG TPA: hypothetical protein VFL47_12635 [Flavisolibacter sp.]|nr:hypothetical protein [Flavisolibacter sp.]
MLKVGPEKQSKKMAAKFGGCHKVQRTGSAKKFRHKHKRPPHSTPLLLRCFLALPQQPPYRKAFLFSFFLFLFFPFSKMFFGVKAIHLKEKQCRLTISANSKYSDWDDHFLFMLVCETRVFLS